MTYEDAYAEGFCKAAEVIGVDPFALVKRAQVKKVIGDVLGRAAGVLRGAKAGAGKAGSRYLELLRGGNPAVLDTGVPLRDSTMLNRLRMRALRTFGSHTAPEISSELRKSLAAQAGTGLGLAGAGAGAAALATSDKPKTPYEKLLAKLHLG